MSDIVERLRDEAAKDPYGSDLAIVPKVWLDEAADEIKRLRHELDVMTGERNGYRSVADIYRRNL